MNWLVIMMKRPELGRVKTRLGREIGTVQATRFYRHAVAGAVSRLGRDPRWRTVLAVAPDTATAALSRRYRLTTMAQGGGGLGARMQRIADCLPPGRMVLIGTDIPGVRPDHIWQAFRAAGRHDAVFGPAGDGGYWLVGFGRRRRSPRPFHPVRWSGPHALGDTIANLRPGETYAIVETLGDVDDGKAYRAMDRLHGRCILPAVDSLDPVTDG